MQNSQTASTAQEAERKGRKPTKLDALTALLIRPNGASLAEMTAATGWQAHSVRGALAGALRKKGHEIVSDNAGGERRYRIAKAV